MQVSRKRPFEGIKVAKAETVISGFRGFLLPKRRK
jgi:hypothetical protein